MSIAQPAEEIPDHLTTLISESQEKLLNHIPAEGTSARHELAEFARECNISGLQQFRHSDALWVAKQYLDAGILPKDIFQDKAEYERTRRHTITANRIYDRLKGNKAYSELPVTSEKKRAALNHLQPGDIIFLRTVASAISPSVQIVTEVEKDDDQNIASIKTKGCSLGKITSYEHLFSAGIQGTMKGVNLDIAGYGSLSAYMKTAYGERGKTFAKTPDPEIDVITTLLGDAAQAAHLQRVNISNVEDGSLLDTIKSYYVGEKKGRKAEKDDHRHGLLLTLDLTKLLPESQYRELKIIAMDTLIGGYMFDAILTKNAGEEKQTVKLTGKTIISESIGARNPKSTQESIGHWLKGLAIALGSTATNPLADALPSKRFTPAEDQVMDGIARFLNAIFKKNIIHKDDKHVQDEKSLKEMMESFQKIIDGKLPKHATQISRSDEGSRDKS